MLAGCSTTNFYETVGTRDAASDGTTVVDSAAPTDGTTTSGGDGGEAGDVGGDVAVVDVDGGTVLDSEAPDTGPDVGPLSPLVPVASPVPGWCGAQAINCGLAPDPDAGIENCGACPDGGVCGNTNVCVRSGSCIPYPNLENKNGMCSGTVGHTGTFLGAYPGFSCDGLDCVNETCMQGVCYW